MLKVKYVYWSVYNGRFYHFDKQIPYQRSGGFGLRFVGKDNGFLCKSMDMIINDRKIKSSTDSLLRGK